MGQAGSPPAILTALQTRVPLIHLLLSSSTQLTPMQEREEEEPPLLLLLLTWSPGAHLKHGDVVLPVDLVGGRVEPAALLHVLVEDAAALHVAQAELTQVELGKSGGVGGRGGRSQCVENRSIDPRVRRSSRTCCTPAGTGTSTTSGFQTCQTR